MSAGTGPSVTLVRHAETEWSRELRHTGRTDVPLTERGREAARRLGAALDENAFELVLVSPLQRARETCDLAGLGDRAELEPDLVEWDYGEYEGRRTGEILAGRPGWELFRDGCPGGEAPEEVAARADRFIARVRGVEGGVLAFSSGHITRMIAARWLGLPPDAGRYFACRTASVGVLGYEHGNRDEPVIGLWNHVARPRE